MFFPIHNVPETFDTFAPKFIDVYAESGPVFSCARRREIPAGSIDKSYEHDTRTGQCSAALAC